MLSYLKRPVLRSLVGPLCALLLSTTAYASDAEECKRVRMTGPGWTDIAATNGIASVLLSALEYAPSEQTLAVPIGFEGIRNGEIDLFLGNWMPAQQQFIDTYREHLDHIGVNLSGAKFTLAVPQHVYDAGVHDFADLAAHAKQFNKRIYGIESGSPANQLLQQMIDADDFDLGDWRLIESGEQGVMSQVRRAVQREKFIVFLGWEPHPMNTNMKMRYLTGGDRYFGPNFGGAEVHTLTRKGLSTDCPNLGQLLHNLTFTLQMENEIMGLILDEKLEPNDAARRWLQQHPEVLEPWLDGVTTMAGAPALPAARGALELP